MMMTKKVLDNNPSVIPATVSSAQTTLAVEMGQWVWGFYFGRIQSPSLVWRALFSHCIRSQLYRNFPGDLRNQSHQIINLYPLNDPDHHVCDFLADRIRYGPSIDPYISLQLVHVIGIKLVMQLTIWTARTKTRYQQIQIIISHSFS